MARQKRDEPLWDPDDAHGVVPSATAYRWSHGWAFYLAVLCGMFGVVAMLGALAPFSLGRLLGALGILSGVLTVRAADRRSRTDRRAALVWVLVTLVAAVGGAALWLATA